MNNTRSIRVQTTNNTQDGSMKNLTSQHTTLTLIY